MVRGVDAGSVCGKTAPAFLLSSLWAVMTVTVGCGADGRAPASLDANGSDARFVPIETSDVAGAGTADAGSDPDVRAVVRDAAPYERPPPAATVSGHGWSWKNVGVTPPDLGGLRLQTNDRAILSAGGAGLSGAHDGLGLGYAKLEGDGEIIARVLSLQMASPQATAGVIIRADDTDPGASSIFLGILADEVRGGQIIVRHTGATAAQALLNDPNIRASQFLRIRREGRRFTCYRSVDRGGWVRLGAVELDLPSTVIAGVAASAGRSSGPAGPSDAGGDAAAGPPLTVAEFDQIRLVQLDDAPAALELEPFIGNGAIAKVTGGAVTITAGGDLLVSTGEPAIGLFAPTSGSQTITARIDALGGPMAPKARVGLTFREGAPGRISPLARHALIGLDASGLAFQKRDRSPNFDPGVSVPGIKPPCWLRLARWDDPVALRTRVMGSYSLDGVTFIRLDTVEMPFADPSVAGLLFTSGDRRVHATAQLSEFAITATTTPIAAPPPDAGTADTASDGAPADAGAGS